MEIELRQDTAEGFAKTNPILEDWEMGKESDTNKMKIGNGQSGWNDLPYVGNGVGGGIKVASSIEEAEAMDIKDGELVNIYSPSTKFEASSLVDVGMVSYDEQAHQITALNGARAITPVPNFGNVLTFPGSGNVWLVSAEAPEATYRLYYSDKEDCLMADYYSNGELIEQSWNADYFYHQELYIYKVVVVKGQNLEGNKLVTSDNFNESKTELRWWDNKISLKGGKDSVFKEMIKLEGKIRSKVVIATPNFYIPENQTFSLGEGELSFSEAVVKGQYIRFEDCVADVPVTSRGDNLAFNSTIIKKDGGNCLTSISTVSCSWIPSKEGEVTVEWGAHTYAFPGIPEFELVQTTFIPKDGVVNITIPNLTRDSNIAGAINVLSSNMLLFKDSDGVDVWGVEGSYDTPVNVVYEIDVSCRKNGTSTYDWTIMYRKKYPDTTNIWNDWVTQRMTHPLPFSCFHGGTAAKDSTTKIFQK